MPEVIIIAPIAAVKGQGLWSTIWNECLDLIIIISMSFH